MRGSAARYNARAVPDHSHPTVPPQRLPRRAHAWHRHHTRVNREQRFQRAVAGLGKWWGVGLLTVLIPVAHFVLVPAFLAYGLWQFFQRLSTAELATDARGTCPDCGAEQALELAPRRRAPQPVTCRQCHRGLRLSLPA